MLLLRKLICSGDHVGQAPPGTDRAEKTADFVEFFPNLSSSDGKRGLFVSLVLACKHLACPADTLRP
jgi:hypothetical protein